MKTRLILPALLLATACSMQAKKSETAPPAPFAFPHQTHVEADVACTECHDGITRSVGLQANVVHAELPKKSEVCANCHDAIPAYTMQKKFEPVVNFDHASHLARVKGDCKGCHAKLPEKGDTTIPVPTMATCTNCHNHAQDFGVGRCMPCHRDLKKYDYKPVAEYSHEANFLETHGRWARESVQTCASCHDQTKCAVCHTATTRPMPPSVQFPEAVTKELIHRGDWISRHAIEQAADPSSCNRCHGPAYCQSCHQFQGISSGMGGRNPHPASWVSQHGTAARLNIASCAACHNQARPNCVTCHTSGGVNPHPPGWKGTGSQKTSNPTCRVCHAT